MDNIQKINESEKSLNVLNNLELNNGDLLMGKDGQIFIIEIEGEKIVIPILKFIKKQRLEEIEWEKSFVKMVVGEIMKTHKISIEDLEKLIWDAIDWWKYKVIWKRPITKDDEKALRMIRSRINNQLK